MSVDQININIEEDEEDDYRIKNIEEINKTMSKKLTENYFNITDKLVGKSIVYNNISILLAIIAFLFTGLGSIAAFSVNTFDFKYIAYIAGCCNVIAMMTLKASYYATSQSNYYETKLKNHLTSEYKFLYKFIMNPLSLQPISTPKNVEIFGEKSYENKNSPNKYDDKRLATPKFPWNTPKINRNAYKSSPNINIPPLNINNT